MSSRGSYRRACCRCSPRCGSRLSFRAGEPGAWAAPLGEDPIAFLLDTVGEVVNVWTTGGELVYSNRAATHPAELDGPVSPGVTSYRRAGRHFERRALAFDAYRTTYVIEVIRGAPLMVEAMRPIRLLLQTTIPRTDDDWHVGRFSMLRDHLAGWRRRRRRGGV